MPTNHFTTAYRSLRKNKAFTLINILGLTIGLAACLLVYFYVSDEIGYDKYNVNFKNIYRIDADVKFGGKLQTEAQEPAPLAATIMAGLPQVQAVTRLTHGGVFNIKKGNETIRENNVVYADPTLFQVFTLPMIYGEQKNALTEPFSMVLTESMAKKYYGKTNALGEMMMLNDKMYQVTGIIRNVPQQSHFHFGFFLSMSSSNVVVSNNANWLASPCNTYILLKPGVNLTGLQSGLEQIIRLNTGSEMQSVMHMSIANFEKNGNFIRLKLMPLKDIHLMSDKDGELDMNGNVQYVYMFSAIGIFILIIACINFINLSTARASDRAREVGVRKVLGSSKIDLIFRFLTESFLIVLIALFLALALDYSLIPLFNNFTGKVISLDINYFMRLMPLLLSTIAVVGFIAGFYPAMILSAFKPVNVLKGKIITGLKGKTLRSSLVVFQFTISIFLIIGTLVVYNQLRYIQNKNLGFNRDQTLIIHQTSILGNNAEVFRREIKQLLGVKDAALSSYLPTNDIRNNGTLFLDQTLDGKKAILSEIWSVGNDYISTLGMKIVQGRDFSSAMATDSSAIILNESAAQLLGYHQPLNKQLYGLSLSVKFVKQMTIYHIIGIVKDFHFSSLHDKITPLAMHLSPDNGSMAIHLDAANLQVLMPEIQNKWNSFQPNEKMEFSFMDQDFDALYRSESRISIAALTFTAIAIFVACFGLFGLSAYDSVQRAKEISIRKILGANVTSIAVMLSMDYLKLVLIATFLAAPIAWYAMNSWLQQFAYRIDISWWSFAIATLSSLILALMTVSYQSLKASVINPVNSLRGE